MPKLVVIDRDGAAQTVAGESGASVMEVIRDNGFNELVALCGGCCSCATCHVYVDEAFASKLPPMSEDEDGLLGGLDQRRPVSRLSFQIPFDETLDGLTVQIGPEE